MKSWMGSRFRSEVRGCGRGVGGTYETGWISFVGCERDISVAEGHSVPCKI